MRRASDLTKAEVRQDHTNNDHKTDDVDDGIHDFFPCLMGRADMSVSGNRSWLRGEPQVVGKPIQRPSDKSATAQGAEALRLRPENARA